MSDTGYVLLLGRLLDLVRRAPDASDNQRTALRDLTERVATAGTTIGLENNVLSVAGDIVPEDTQFASILRQQMDAHGLAEIRLVTGAAPADLLELTRALAKDLGQFAPGQDVARQLSDEGVTGAAVLTKPQVERARARRGMRVTEAVQKPSDSKAAEEKAVEGIVPAARGAAYQEMERKQRRSSTPTLAGAARHLHELSGERLFRQIEAIQNGVEKSLGEQELERALEAMVALIEEESVAQDDAMRRTLGVAIRRILSSTTLDQLARHLLDEVYRNDIAKVIRRAGASGTKVLLDRLVEAPSYAERRAYLEALRQIDEGRDAVASLLNHHEWFVVRNAADLVGDLRIEQAVQALGKVATHDDPRVRRSVGIALAKIGSPSSVQYLARIVRDSDGDVRVAVLREIGGRGVAALGMPLVTALQGEQNQDVLSESFRALGRIGTPDAVQALAAAAIERGGLLSRRPVGTRLAAIEGLTLAGSPPAFQALTQLAEDKTKQVRDAARHALASWRR